VPRVIDPTKKVTDPVALKHLERQGKVAENWELWHDYASRKDAQGKPRKEFSPYGKFYRNTDNPSDKLAVFSGLPMVDCDGVKCEPKWIQNGPNFTIKNNVFHAQYQDNQGRLTLTVKNDDPLGRKKNDRNISQPQLFVGGIEIARHPASLLPVDPLNENYLENTLEWDYGVCKRRLRTVEGRIHGYWIFSANPNADVRIQYNQTGEYKLKLGQYKETDDSEFIQKSIFDSAVYPFEVSDSATYYPDADPETTSVDGTVNQVSGAGASWSTIRNAAGSQSSDNDTTSDGGITSHPTTDLWYSIKREIALFDSSGLPDAATKSAAVLSCYGVSKQDNLSITPNIQAYLATPASNTALQNSDYAQIGTVAQSSAIAYADWSTTGYNAFTLNDLSQISTTGVSKFGLRNANYDVADSPPAWSGSYANSRVRFYFSEQGTGYKPKLVVTYTTGTTYENSVTEGLVFGSSTSSYRTIGLSASDTVRMADSQSNPVSMQATRFDSMVLNDSSQSGLSAQANASDLLRLIDTLATLGNLQGQASDNLVTNALASGIGQFGASVSDILTTGDLARAGMAYLATAIDSFTLSDYSIGDKALGITVTEHLTADGVTSTQIQFAATAIDRLTTQDVSLSSISIQGVVSDTVTFSSAVLAGLNGIANALDRLDIRDSTLANATFQVTASDSVRLQATVAALLQFLATANDSFTLSDITIATTGARARSITITFKLQNRSLTMKLPSRSLTMKL